METNFVALRPSQPPRKDPTVGVTCWVFEVSGFWLQQPFPKIMTPNPSPPPRLSTHTPAVHGDPAFLRSYQCPGIDQKLLPFSFEKMFRFDLRLKIFEFLKLWSNPLFQNLEKASPCLPPQLGPFKTTYYNATPHPSNPPLSLDVNGTAFEKQFQHFFGRENTAFRLSDCKSAGSHTPTGVVSGPLIPMRYSL